MKKNILYFICILSLILIFAISCNNSNNVEDLTGTVNFAGDGSRSLSTALNLPGAEDLYWYYTAEKVRGLNTGAATNQRVKEGTGLNATVGPFSVGRWNFTLYGYAKDSSGAESLVYQGNKNSVTIQAGVINSVDVDVEYVGTAGKGTLNVNQIYLLDRQGNIPASETGTITIKKINSTTTTSSTYNLVKNEENKFSYQCELDHGVYELSFTFTDSASWVNKSVSKTVLILAGRTTVITGNVSEDTGNASFDVDIKEDNPIIAIDNYFYVTTGNSDDYLEAVRRAQDYSLINHVTAYVVFNNNVTTQESLTLSSPSALSRTLEENNSEVVLDLNGNTLIYNGNTSAIEIDNPNTTLRIQDGQGAEGAIISNNLVIDVKKGSLTVESGSISGVSAISVSEGAAATVSGGAINATATTINNDGTLNISGGLITSANAVAIKTSGNLNVSGSTISGKSALMVTDNAEITLSNVILTATDSNYQAIVKTGNVTNTVSTDSTVVFNDNQNGQSNVIDVEGSLGGFGTATSPYLISDSNVLAHLTQPDTYFLLVSDIVIEQYNTLPFGINLDLNNHKLYLDSTIFINNQYNLFNEPFTVKNGQVISRTNSNNAMVFSSGTKFKSENVSFESKANGILIDKYAKNVSIEVIDSVMKVSGYFGISTNASCNDSNPVSEKINITIKNSSIVADRLDYDSTGILFNVKGNVVIENSTIKAGRQAVILRGGNHRITNSTLEVIGNKNFNDYTDHCSENAWGEGNQVAHATLVIGNKGNSQYQYPTTVELDNLKLVIPSTTDHFAMYVWQYSDADDRKVNVSGTLSSDSATTVNEDKNQANYSVSSMTESNNLLTK